MDVFEHLSMVVFLILGLGLVKLMTSFGSVLSANLIAKDSGEEPARLYWVHTALVGMVFTGMVVYWWNAYPLNNPDHTPVESWHLGRYLLFLGSPITYFLMADVLMPRDARLSGLDLKAYYYANSRVLAFLCLVLQVFSLVNLLVFYGQGLGSRQVIGRYVLILLIFPLIFSKNEKLHGAIIGSFAVGFVYSILKYHLYLQ